ncbi:hypothetical protein MHYP_G00309650 [Metynnis hypsauchen]
MDPMQERPQRRARGAEGCSSGGTSEGGGSGTTHKHGSDLGFKQWSYRACTEDNGVFNTSSTVFSLPLLFTRKASL